MKVAITDPPREFTVGEDNTITLKEVGSLRLEENELVTFHTDGESDEEAGTRFDVTRTPFGYYATNSLNGSLPQNGLRPALSRNAKTGRLFLLLVDPAKMAVYAAYLEAERMEHLGWLDTIDTSMLAAKPL